MTSRRILSLLAVLALAACAGAPVSTTPAPSAEGGTKRPNAADARFMLNMIGHHAQAIEVSRLAPERAGSQQIRVLAARIINAQRDEIATMQRWLRDHGITPPHVDTTGAVHPSTGSGQAASGAHAHAAAGAGQGGDHAHHGMPGMLTHAQIEELKQARGKEFDRLFLVNMIRHHKGAVTMVEQLVNSTGAAQDDIVFKLAHDVNVDQTTEIDRMQKMLTELLFGASAAP